MPQDHIDFHRTNINLFREDVNWLVTTHGYGWTEKVRDIVHDYVRNNTIYLHPIFRDHSCWRCRDGQIPCVAGSPAQCEFPHARND